MNREELMNKEITVTGEIDGNKFIDIIAPISFGSASLGSLKPHLITFSMMSSQPPVLRNFKLFADIDWEGDVVFFYKDDTSVELIETCNLIEAIRASYFNANYYTKNLEIAVEHLS